MQRLGMASDRKEGVGKMSKGWEEINKDGSSLPHQLRPRLEAMIKLLELGIEVVYCSEAQDKLCCQRVCVSSNVIPEDGRFVEQAVEHLDILKTLIRNIRLGSFCGEAALEYAVAKFPRIRIFLVLPSAMYRLIRSYNAPSWQNSNLR
jgi:hypothetical protein